MHQAKYTVENDLAVSGTFKLIRHAHIGAGVYAGIVIDSDPDYDVIADMCMDLNKIEEYEVNNACVCEFD